MPIEGLEYGIGKRITESDGGYVSPAITPTPAPVTTTIPAPTPTPAPAPQADTSVRTGVASAAARAAANEAVASGASPAQAQAAAVQAAQSAEPNISPSVAKAVASGAVQQAQETVSTPGEQTIDTLTTATTVVREAATPKPETTVIVNAPQAVTRKVGFFDKLIGDIETFINKLKSGNLGQTYQTNQWDGIGQTYRTNQWDGIGRTRRAAQGRYQSAIHSRKPDGTLRELEEE